MHIDFVKYQGTGNDFIIIDNRELLFPGHNITLIQKLCHRKLGVGADGLMLIEEHEEVDFRMRYYNADGSESLCGNGSRCAIHFAHHLGLIKNETTFITTDGIHHGSISTDQVRFQLHNITGVDRIENDFFVNNGSPHYVRFVDNAHDTDVVKIGRLLRNNPKYAPHGTNVNFVEQKNNRLKVRTYERGVEDETLSCGTGVTASAICASFNGYKSPITIETPGGILTVSFAIESNGSFSNVCLAGAVVPVYEGRIRIS